MLACGLNTYYEIGIIREYYHSLSMNLNTWVNPTLVRL